MAQRRSSQVDEPKEQGGRQEGSMWLDKPPSRAEFASWFDRNVRVHDGLEAARYLSGVILLEDVRTIREVQIDEDGVPREVEIVERTYTPYPKVETRVAYFWDWCDANTYLGEIEVVPHPAGESKQLPVGFFQARVELDARAVPLIGVSYRVGVWEFDRRAPDGRGAPVRRPPEGTKTVPLVRQSRLGVSYVDADAFAKAQTGAIGRALGNAGMLIVPGAGIATYEDMVEHREQGPAAAGAANELPPVVTPESTADAGQARDALLTLITQHLDRLKSEYPDGYTEAEAWAREKGINLLDIPDSEARVVERMLREKVRTGERAAAAAA